MTTSVQRSVSNPVTSWNQRWTPVADPGFFKEGANLLFNFFWQLNENEERWVDSAFAPEVCLCRSTTEHIIHWDFNWIRHLLKIKFSLFGAP